METTNTNTEPSSIEADLDVLITTGQIERKVKPFAGREWYFTMHTLSNAERCEMSGSIPNKIAATIAGNGEANKALTLEYAITELDKDGQIYAFRSASQRAVLHKLLGGMSTIMVDMLYVKYLEMADDMIKVLDTGVKKN